MARVGTCWSTPNHNRIAAHPALSNHDDVIKWKPFPRYWPFVRGIHRSPVNSPHKGQWRGSLMFSLICTWMNGWVNNREAGDLRRHRSHYDVKVICVLWAHASSHCRKIIPAWISNHMPSEVWDEIHYPFSLCNSGIIKKFHITFYNGCNN